LQQLAQTSPAVPEAAVRELGDFAAQRALELCDEGPRRAVRVDRTE